MRAWKLSDTPVWHHGAGALKQQDQATQTNRFLTFDFWRKKTSFLFLGQQDTIKQAMMQRQNLNSAVCCQSTSPRLILEDGKKSQFLKSLKYSQTNQSSFELKKKIKKNKNFSGFRL